MRVRWHETIVSESGVDAFYPQLLLSSELVLCAQVWHRRYQAQVIKAEKYKAYSDNPNISGDAELLRIRMVCLFVCPWQ